ncbi:DNA polymerase III subunit beta [Rickettsiales endosymbiont of Peranema trichophorum]|uniref:DNA polymerase III subunit beta n=1 Tax=Rickettsiales endosymbiont of Peranema trichophorum TaxID=2486577 RepID=UPI001023614E|nr:DNA polymerase III subunit beta [Rickettsiales endosymbiont of Peranema trichophorum]RZI46783.1 DNA polymerase III subunit beta [Rickettsiales endosymbiont of Peranema trichophorum]
MHVVVQKADLLKALGYITSVVEKRNTIPVLSNVKIEALGDHLSLTTTDIDIAVRDVIPATVQAPLLTTVPAITLYDIVRKISDDSTITFEQTTETPDQISVKFGSSLFVLPCISSDEFPNFDLGVISHTFDVHSNILKALLSKTKHAISTDEARYYLNGVYLHVHKSNKGLSALRAVATDGHRLAKVDAVLPTGLDAMPGVIIPRKTVMEVVSLLEAHDKEVTIGVSEKKIMFQIGTIRVSSKLIDGKFPDYDRVIPKGNDKCMEVKVKDILSAIDLVIAISQDKVKSVKFDIEPSKLTLTASSLANSHLQGLQAIQVAYNSTTHISISFNSRYLLDALSVVDGDLVRLKLFNNSVAIIIHDASDESSTYVVMPMEV